MTVKVLMVSRYVQPEIKFSNANVYRQAKSLQTDHDVDIEILTWPCNDGWAGPIPSNTDGFKIPPFKIEIARIIFHIIRPPNIWNERTLQPTIWSNAVDFGVRMLQSIRPDIVHLQHWFGLWWILESAQKLGIPTVYTNHDWGIACLRTVLVMGDSSLCDGKILIDKCIRCIWQGRGMIGKANELVAQSTMGRRLIETAYRSRLKRLLEKQGAVRLSLQQRVTLHLDRVMKVLEKLDALFVPSNFAQTFFSRLGVAEEHIQIKPWYHDPVQLSKTVTTDQPFTITYIGRVSADKGVHLIFEALSRIRSDASIHLKIAGANNTSYCNKLKYQYASHVGQHTVEWMGWTSVEPLFRSTDVCIIPSTWIDNTPLSLVEALSYKVPLIATRVPPIVDLVIDNQNGYLADYNSIESLISAIKCAVRDKANIRSGTMCFPKINSCREYTQMVKNTYLKCIKH